MEPCALKATERYAYNQRQYQYVLGTVVIHRNKTLVNKKLTTIIQVNDTRQGAELDPTSWMVQRGWDGD